MKYRAKWITLGYLLGCATLLQAQPVCSTSVPESTPTAEFTDSGNGTVTHSKTGLVWKRCAEGQSWTGGTCTGSASAATWANAFKAAVTASTAGFGDWRLPNLKELRSIVEERCYGSAINASVFPNAPASYFWSASATALFSSSAWVVNFDNGSASTYGKSYAYQLRLVRAGQSFGSFDALDTVPLSVVKTGTGLVSGGPVSCGSVCSGYVGRGFAVTLTASPAVNFISWGGACAGAATTCTLAMDAAKDVTANFKVVPTMSVAPASLVFAIQNLGSSSAAQTVALSNTGSAPLAIASITVSSDYAVTHNCGSGLGVSGFCALSIRFAPTAVGPRNGTVTITDDAYDSPQLISLSGTGQGAVVALSATSKTFGNQGTGSTSAAQSITLSNPGGAVLNITSIVASGDFARTTTCGATLAQGADCVINLTFTPTALGARTGSIVITSDAVSSPNTITLSGTGVASPWVTLSPTAVSFGAQNVGSSSAAQTVVLTNTGTATLNLSSIAATGDFAVTNTCGSGLGAGGSCSLSITFRPTATGIRSGAIAITSNAAGSPHSVSLSGGTGVASATRLVNLSTRGQVLTSDNVMIGGFVVGGSTPKKVLVRAVGPTLANYGVTGVLADPTLQLFSGPTAIASNDDWGSASNSAEIQATGLAPVNAKESAILTTLNPGAYTAIVWGVAGGTGVGIVEVFELDNPDVPFVNISTRGQVLTGDNVMIGGFVIQGDSSKTVLIRAVGPNLANYGVTGVLANPTLQLFSGSTAIAGNDDWGSAANAAAIAATGLAPVNPLESAILITLQPGAYTAIVSGVGGGIGVGIVEVFVQ